jgi:hypothetical protein
VSQLGEHPADLAFLSLGEDQLKLRSMPLAADDPSALGADFTVGQPDSFGDLGEDLRARQARNQRAIDLLDAVTRMCQLVRQLAVVGQNQEAGAILVEATDRVDSLGNFGQKINNAWAPRGIKGCRHMSFGFIDGIINLCFEADWLAVHRDASDAGVDPGAKLANGLAVDEDATLKDQLLASTPRSQSGVRQDFLKTLEFSRLAINRSALAASVLFMFMLVARGVVVTGFSPARWGMRARAATWAT